MGVPNREAFHGFVIENCDFYTKSPEPFELKGENSGIFYAAAGIQITKHGKRLERTVVENVYGTNLRFWNLKHAIWAETIHITTDEPVQGDNKEYIGYIAGLAFDKLYINNCYIGIRCNTNNASFDEYLIQTKVGMKYGFYGVASLTNGYIYDLYDGKNNPGHPAVGAVYTGVIDNKVGTYHTGHQTKNVVIDDGVVRGRRLYDHGWIDDLPNETYNSLRFSDNEFKKMPWYKYYGIRDNQLAFFLKKGGTMRVNGVDYLTGHNNADSAFDPFLRKLENRSFKLKLDNKKTAADPNVVELEFGEQNCSLIGFQTEAPCKFVKIEYRIKNPNYGKPVTGNEEPPPEFLWKELFSDQENRETTIGVPLNSSGTAKVVGIRYSFAEAQYQGDDIVDQADNLYINHLFMFQHDHLPEMCLAVGGGKLYGGLDLNGLFLNKANVAVPETLSGFNQLPLLDKDGVPHLATEEISTLSTIPEAAVFYLLGDTPPKSPCSMLQLFIKSENTVIQEFTGTVDTVYQSARRTGQLTKHEEYNQNKELVRRYYTLVWSAWTEQNSVKVLEEKKVDRANIAGGFEGGSGASAETTSNGVTSKTGGAAIGSEARAGYGGAAGFRAKANSGGAVGDNTLAYDGFSGGQGAKAASGVNAVQLGAGTNSEANSLQVYGYQLMDGQGHVPDARIPKLATGKVIETKTVNNFNSIPSSSSTGYFNYELSDGYESATVINNAVDFNAPDTIAQHMLLDGKLYYRKKNGFSSNSKWYSAYAGDSIELLSYTYSSETLSMSRSKCYLVDFTGSQNTLSLGYDDGPGIYHIFVTLHGDEFGIWSPNCRWQNGIAPDYVAETTYELTFVYDGTNAFGSFKVYPAL